jgi:hypothetical protein
LGAFVICLNCANRLASVESAVPTPQSIGTAMGLPGFEGLGVLYSEFMDVKRDIHYM